MASIVGGWYHCCATIPAAGFVVTAGIPWSRRDPSAGSRTYRRIVCLSFKHRFDASYSSGRGLLLLDLEVSHGSGVFHVGASTDFLGEVPHAVDFHLLSIFAFEEGDGNPALWLPQRSWFRRRPGRSREMASLTMSSTFCNSSLVIGASWVKSNLSLSVVMLDPFCPTCVPSTILRA